ncbi:MAG: SCO family protein [Usitatibacter sp.]
MTAAALLRATALVLCGALALAAHATIEPQSALAASRAAIGSQPPNFAFTDTSGRRVSLADYRGKPLVVSFVYTGCSQVCPTTTRELAKSVRGARAVVGADAFNIASIGFNIPSDNPVSMRVFARQNAIDDDPRWMFLVPDAGAPEPLARAFGFVFEPAAGGFEHLTQVTILDGNGRVYAQLPGESFALPMLVNPLRALALGEPAPGGGFAAVAERVRLLCTVYDPLSGKYRLDYRLFIELAVGIGVLSLILGFLVREHRRSRRPC